MINYSTYDVAVMNYPLFDKYQQLSNVETLLFDSTAIDDFEIPIYIHIPFCDSLCDFCIYNRSFATENSSIVEHYVQSLMKEIQMYAAHSYVRAHKTGSVFIGGGTPTVLNENQLGNLLETIHRCFNIKNCEITVECNMASAGDSKLKLLKKLGVTRISTGVQTFDDNLRGSLHIQKESDYVIRWFDNTHKFNFKELSMDLIYGFPNTDTDHILIDIKKAISLNIGHISVYKLAAFAYTKLYKNRNNSKYRFPAEAEVERMFYRTHDYLQNNGYLMQSVQEYGTSGNGVKFWDLTYDGYGNNLSFGLSSFGYMNGYCYQNETDIREYIEKINHDVLPIQRISSKINDIQLLERVMVIGFRKGSISKKIFSRTFHREIKNVFKTQIDKQLKEGLIGENAEAYYLTPKGLYNQGKVSAEYMISIFKNTSTLKKKMCIGSHYMP